MKSSIHELLSQASTQTGTERMNYLLQNLSHLSSYELVAIVHDLMLVATDYTSSCDEAVWLHLVTNGQHPDSFNSLNVPSFSAAIKGLALTDVAIDTSKLCDTCAYRAGTLGNHSETTQSDVETAMAHGEVFYCHDDAKGTVKMKACQGYVQHRKEWRYLNEIHA